MIGVDEVGRGCWAGPLLVVAAKPKTSKMVKLRDSKKLTKSQRNEVFSFIENNFYIGEGWVSPVEIDNLGLTKSMILGVKRALTEISALNDEEIVIDGNINYCEAKYFNSRCQIKADDNIYPVMAASIYAKVTRDLYMVSMSIDFPDYSFEKNVGYGTKEHILALESNGICEIHRKSYRPIKRITHAN